MSHVRWKGSMRGKIHLWSTETLGLYFVFGLHILPVCTVQNYCPSFWGCTSVLSHSVKVCLGLRRSWVTCEINVSLRKDQSLIHPIYLMTAWPVRICTFEGSVKVGADVRTRPVTLIVQSLAPWCVTLGWDFDGSCSSHDRSLMGRLGVVMTSILISDLSGAYVNTFLMALTLL